eukprot:Nk52_evm5s373 gene=Nk52_evmTU5s373
MVKGGVGVAEYRECTMNEGLTIVNKEEGEEGGKGRGIIVDSCRQLGTVGIANGSVEGVEEDCEEALSSRTSGGSVDREERAAKGRFIVELVKDSDAGVEKNEASPEGKSQQKNGKRRGRFKVDSVGSVDEMRIEGFLSKKEESITEEKPIMKGDPADESEPRICVNNVSCGAAVNDAKGEDVSPAAKGGAKGRETRGGELERGERSSHSGDDTDCSEAKGRFLVKLVGSEEFLNSSKESVRSGSAREGAAKGRFIVSSVESAEIMKKSKDNKCEGDKRESILGKKSSFKSSERQEDEATSPEERKIKSKSSSGRFEIDAVVDTDELELLEKVGRVDFATVKRPNQRKNKTKSRASQALVSGSTAKDDSVGVNTKRHSATSGFGSLKSRSTQIASPILHRRVSSLTRSTDNLTALKNNGDAGRSLSRKGSSENIGRSSPLTARKASSRQSVGGSLSSVSSSESAGSKYSNSDTNVNNVGRTGAASGARFIKFRDENGVASFRRVVEVNSSGSSLKSSSTHGRSLTSLVKTNAASENRSEGISRSTSASLANSGQRRISCENSMRRNKIAHQQKVRSNLELDKSIYDSSDANSSFAGSRESDMDIRQKAKCSPQGQEKKRKSIISHVKSLFGTRRRSSGGIKTDSSCSNSNESIQCGRRASNGIRKE